MFVATEVKIMIVLVSTLVKEPVKIIIDQWAPTEYLPYVFVTMHDKAQGKVIVVLASTGRAVVKFWCSVVQIPPIAWCF